MSYDVYLEIDTGTGNKAEVASLNYTANVTWMWRKALEGAAIGGVHIEALYDLDGLDAGACVPALRRAVAAMDDDRAAFVAMNPANGWGDADGARGFLKTIADLCEQHPNCTLRVSH